MKSTGLGDSVEKFTKATGIKTMVDTMSKGLNLQQLLAFGIVQQKRIRGDEQKI